MKYRTFILFGAPGSGKGTQGKTLGTIPRFYHCPCGDVFRSIDTRTKVGKAFLEYSRKGQLVPDDITVELWKEAIDAAVDAHKFKPDIDILVLDGIPRNVNQAKIMRELIDVEKVFHLACPNRETLFGRLKKRALKDNRLDDANEDVIQKRLDIYEMESKPVLTHYTKDCISVIDAMQTTAIVVFIGTGEIGVPTLRALQESDHELVGVVTQPDKPVGRAQKITAPPIKAALVESNLSILQPARIKDSQSIDQIRALAPDVIVVMA